MKTVVIFQQKVEQDINEMMKTFVSYHKSGTNYQAENPQASSMVTNKYPYYTNKDLPLQVIYWQQNGGMWMPKHEIISPKFYDLLLKIETKG